MRKAKKLYVLLGILVVLSVAVFAVSRHEEKKEEIRTSDEIILTIPTDSVSAVSWTNESGEFAFSLNEDGTWVYEGDESFPADPEKIASLLEQFEECGAAFTIENADDLGQYGLDDPICTITITADDETYTVTLGDYSQMDSERYASIDDGNVYLLSHDPLDEFDAVLSDVILHDTIPDLTDAAELTFSGEYSYTAVREEDSGKSICADDVYFVDDLPLDTSNVSSYLASLDGLTLTNYVTYNASEEDLAAYGLDDPTLTVTVTYPITGDEDDEDSETAEEGTITVHFGQNVEELADAEESGDYDDVTCYARVGDSGIIYTISGTTYDKLVSASTDDLRHAAVFTADFEEVTAMEITLDDETYTFTKQTENDEDSKKSDDEDDEDAVTWLWNETEFDVSSIRSALQAVKASEFTDDKAGSTMELRIKLTLDNESFPSLTLAFYRNGGENCLATADGETVAYVPRGQVVSLAEAIRTITLGE